MPIQLTKLIAVLTKLVAEGFTGNITVNVASGIPRKLKVEQVQDL